jgi:hypothetical protein
METKKEFKKGHIVIDGVEYVSQKEAVEIVGLTRPTFLLRVSHFGIQEFRRNCRRVMYRLEDIENGIKNGWFQTWY